MADKNKEIIEVKVNRADAMQAKHDFFRRFIPLEDVRHTDVPLFEQVCAIEFAKAFPRASRAIKKGLKENKPVLIEGFALGYVPQINNQWNLHPDVTDTGKNFTERTGQRYKHAHGILFHSVKHLMGFQSDQIFSGIVSANASDGKSDDIHTHEAWALVIGLRGIKDVATRLYVDKEEIAAPVLKRGSVLLIPPRMKHSVDGWEVMSFPISPTLERNVIRNTMADFLHDEPVSKFTHKEIERGQARFIRIHEQAR